MQGGVVFVVLVAIFDLCIWFGILTSPASHRSENRLHLGVKFGFDVFFIGVLFFYLLNFLAKGHERKDYVCAIYNATTCEDSCYTCEGGTCNPDRCDTPGVPDHCGWLTDRELAYTFKGDLSYCRPNKCAADAALLAVIYEWGLLCWTLIYLLTFVGSLQYSFDKNSIIGKNKVFAEFAEAWRERERSGGGGGVGTVPEHGTDDDGLETGNGTAKIAPG